MKFPIDKMEPIGFKFGEPYPNNSFFRKNGLSGKPHLGIDIICPIGTTIKAPESGVARALWNTDGGNVVELIGTYTHRLMHLEYPGNSGKVSEGETLGKSGNTGKSSKPHCHWDVRRNGTTINFANFIDPLSLIIEGGKVTEDQYAQTYYELAGNLWKHGHPGKTPNEESLKNDCRDAARRRFDGEIYAFNSYVDKWLRGD
ncbi:MAG: M23 family metallopeptidase [Candidatus Eisenbacteria bacterium]|nr:M23 family metallopeptidase [Candidatus Eisenbacteria bacterium]